jgi:hypothetical protein
MEQMPEEFLNTSQSDFETLNDRKNTIVRKAWQKIARAESYVDIITLENVCSTMT